MKLTVSFKNHFIKEYFITQDEVIIGSREDSDLHIDSLAISPHHCKISLQNEALYVESLDLDNPTLIDQKKIDHHKLVNGDILKIGKHTLAFSCDTDEQFVLRHKHATDQTNQQGCLQIMSGENLGRIIRLSKPTITLGKTGSTSAIIQRRHTGFYLSVSTGSTASPKVGRQTIGSEPYLLNEGDILEIDGISMQFFMDTQ